MAPKVAPGKNAPPKNPPPQTASGRPTKNAQGVKSSGRGKAKERPPASKRKGWLETKADWEKFEAWAKVKAQPRKMPEPEPIVRASKPLAQMKKKIAVLSRPNKQHDTECRTDLGVSKKALTAKPSKRILELAKFVVKHYPSCRSFPVKISRAALRYKASQRIIDISRPHDFISEHCKSLSMSQSALIRKGTSVRLKRLALAKMANECPESITAEEMNYLMTPTGIYRSALEYKFTAWMNYLSLPSYRFLKDQTSETAEKWKKLILEENETRGKKAVEAKKKKEEKERKRQEDAVKLENREQKEQKEKPEEEEKEAESPTENVEDNPEVTTPEKTNDLEDGPPLEENTQIKGSEPEPEEKKETTKEAAEAIDTNITDEEDEAAKEKRAAKNAWRFQPLPYKDNPFEIKKSALTGKVSPRMAELAQPHIRKDLSSRKKPFDVRKSALDGPIPGRMTELAKPNHPRDPVERPPPRDKDAFGRPIYPIPPYGKKIPKVKYKPVECPEKKEKTDDEEEKPKNSKKDRAIDPIVYEATIDPCIDPERAKRQEKARKAAKERMTKLKEAEETEKENEPETTDTPP